MNNKFKVGDEVEVVGRKCATRGRRGVVVAITNNKTWPYKVQFYRPVELGEFAADELQIA